MKINLPSVAGLLLTMPSALAAPTVEARQSSLTPFKDVTVFSAPSTYTSSGTLYGRSVQLPDSSILTTWENYSPEPPMVYFPIYRSTDYGKTWSEWSRVQDQTRGMGLRYQPDLYVLPGPLGNLPAGTVLLSGSAIPKDLSSTHIELYASTDSGKTWKFVSHVADGGRAYPNNGETPVWEPFMLYLNGALTIYYSDQRDPAYGQKLVHQTTKDGVNWGPVVNDVRGSSYNLRPGMPTIAKMPNGNWIMTYENVNDPAGNAPVYYKISNDPLSWDNKAPVALVANNGWRPQSSPFVVVTQSGKIIVSGGQGTELYINDSNAQGQWRTVQPGQERSYTRCLTLIKQKGQTKQYLMVTGGGWFNDKPTNRVSVGVDDFTNW